MPVHKPQDLIASLLADHEQVKQMFSRFDSAGRSHWRDMFCELTNNLVRHEVAEEEVVYPEVRKALPDGDRLADERIREQADAEKLLARMEKMDAGSETFASSLDQLRGAVLAHAEREEQTVFTPLGSALDSSRSQELGGRYQNAKDAAPTHPHPHAPDTPPGNMLIGPVAALFDRVRDAVRKH